MCVNQSPFLSVVAMAVMWWINICVICLLQRGAFVCEPAILVKRRGRGSQVWTMEKFENKIIDMRDMYEERKAAGVPLLVHDSEDSDMVCVPCFA